MAQFEASRYGAWIMTTPNITDDDAVVGASRQGSLGLFARMADNWRYLWAKYKSPIALLSLVLLFLFAILYNRIVYNVGPGEAGVIWYRFFDGTNLEEVYGEGIHLIFPWDRFYVYDVRVQQEAFSFEALSSNGLPIKFDMSVRYRPFLRTLPILHQNVGPDYVERIVKPEVQAHVRSVVANYLPEEIYTSEGFLLPIIKQGTTFAVAERNVLLDDVLIKRITLPPYIQAAIERKLEQEQAALEYEFRLAREELEANRKRIEAGGIRDFQRTVMQGGAFSQYLTFVGVQASLALAQSENAKVVIFGGGQDGQLPLILNMDSGSQATTPNPDSVDEDAPSDAFLGLSAPGLPETPASAQPSAANTPRP